ncbi:MAG: ABC transporter substrate-binding protein/permease [bacterium]
MGKISSILVVIFLIFSYPLLLFAQQDTSEKIFTSALTGKYPPFSYVGIDGKLTGFDVEVSQEIARRMGVKLQLVTTEWDGILAGLLAGKYDVIIGSMAVTQERKRQVNFSIPYYHSGAQLFIHRDNPDKVYSIEECRGKRIATGLGETYQHYLEENYPEIQVVTLKSPAEIFTLLEQKRITGFVSDRLVGAWQIKQSGRPFVPIGDMLYKEDIAIPVRLDDTVLLSKINNALKDMQHDGTLNKKHNKYFSLDAVKSKEQTGSMSQTVIISKLLRGFGITISIALISIVLGFMLAIPCGLLLTYRKGALFVPSLIIRTIVDFLRGTPVLIQLLFVWMGLGLTPYIAAIGTLGINTMAYMSEVIRAGLMSVDPGQARAAQALGLSKIQRFRFVIWPQAFRIAVPPLMNSVVALTKDTALISIISIPEVIREAQSIISVTFEPGKYYFISAVLFFAVTFPLMKLAGRLEKRIKQKGFIYD